MVINLKSKSAREALAPRRNPYFHCLKPGLYIGYRRLVEGDGTWIARRLQEGSKKYVFRSFGALSGYEEAVRETEAWAAGVDVGVSHKGTLLEAACKNYVEHQRIHKSKASADDAEGRFKRLVYGKKIGTILLNKLLPQHLREWMTDQLDEDGDEEDLRKSKDSANRNLNTIKAALNLARRDQLVSTDAGWKTVTPFPKAGRRRTGDLTPKDRATLLSHCDPDLAALVKALLLTAVRPGEIASCNVSDFDAGNGTLTLTGKTGMRTVTLSTAAVVFFKDQAKSKLPGAPLLADAYGTRWNKDSWKKRFRAAVKAAGLPDSVVMYTLRHVGISELIAGGVDVFLVAKLAGTSTTMIDKHYGHLRHTQTRAALDAAAMG